MAIAPIFTWLNSTDKNYQLGVALYNQYGNKSHLKTFFKNGNSDYHFNRLLDVLTDLNEDISIVVTATRSERPAGFIIPELEAISVPQTRYSLSDKEWNEAPETLKDLYTKTSRLKSRADLIYHQTRIAPTKDERLQLALAQLADRHQVNVIWKEIKEYHATGLLKEIITAEQEKPVNDLGLAELIKLSQNLPPYITKARQRLELLTPGTSKYEKKRQALREYEVKLKLVKERMANV
jgi:hypothetical protein